MHSSLSIDYVRILVWFRLGWHYVLAQRAVTEVPPKRPMRCRECGGELHLVEITDHLGRVLYRHPLCEEQGRDSIAGTARRVLRTIESRPPFSPSRTAGAEEKFITFVSQFFQQYPT